MIRKPAVAGSFYDSDPQRLKGVVQGFLKDEPKTRAVGIMVPHAGYVYSGAVAGNVYSRIEPAGTYIVLSPNHTGLGPQASVMCRGAWQTPLGELQIDQGTAESVVQASPFLKDDERAHQYEHSIEVQLPFLQVLGGGTIVPITLMNLAYSICEKIGLSLAEVVRSCPRPVLVIASSDMTHFESHDSAKRKDGLALDRVETLDPRGLYDLVKDEQISMCGLIPSTIMLIAAKALGGTRASVVQYATSGDVSGDFEQVVGYAGVIVE